MKRNVLKQYVVIFLLSILTEGAHAVLSRPSSEAVHCRRSAIESISQKCGVLSSSSAACVAGVFRDPDAAAAAAAAGTTSPASHDYAPGGLAAKLAKRDASVLRNAVFNVPPGPQVYPAFMRGEWNVESRFRGFLFPSSTLPKEKVASDPLVPGFQKCSVAAVCDVGRPVANHRLRIVEKTGLEDRAFDLVESVNAYLGYLAVEDVAYDARANPNRISIDFVKNRTRNAERIELFCNARESELVDASPTTKVFVCSEYVRQVTFSLSQEFGVARQVNGNYAHFWTWREQEDGTTMTGNLLTAAYLDPQDPLFFQEPSKPVVVYSQDMVATKIL